MELKQIHEFLKLEENERPKINRSEKYTELYNPSDHLKRVVVDYDHYVQMILDAGLYTKEPKQAGEFLK
jgi:hypothetical protein